MAKMKHRMSYLLPSIVALDPTSSKLLYFVCEDLQKYTNVNTFAMCEFTCIVSKNALEKNPNCRGVAGI